MGNTKSKKRRLKSIEEFENFAKLIENQKQHPQQKQSTKFNKDLYQLSIFDDKKKIIDFLEQDKEPQNLYIKLGDNIFQIKNIRNNENKKTKEIALQFIKKEKQKDNKNIYYNTFQNIESLKKPYFIDYPKENKESYSNDQNVFYTSNINSTNQSKSRTLKQTPKFEAVKYLELHQLVSKDQLIQQKQSTVFNLDIDAKDQDLKKSSVTNYSINNEAKYTGEMLLGLPHGQGALVYNTGTNYEGDFENGKKHGFGRLHIPEQFTYKGQFSNDYFDGVGEKKNQNGTVYKGEFKKGLEDGQGVLKNKQGEIIQRGFWKSGMFMDNQLVQNM